MNQKTLFRISLSVLVIILAFVTCRMDISRIQNPQWVMVLIIVMTVNYMKEVRKSLRGEIIAWNRLTLTDKLIFPACTIVLLVFILLPIELGLSLGIILAFIMIGFAFAWYIAGKLGSDALKDFLLFG